jgi:glycosyltransferase involved in cell wall biosynthesis
MAPGVTLAMIVRNEAAKLRRCLESARRAVDAIVVVDTGSEDESPAVASEMGSSVVRITWPEDFAAARNVALEKVETNWVLWLDADEWLAEGAAAQIREAAKSDQAYAFLLTRRDLFPDGGHAEQQMLRLWRHDPKVRFEGVIHEHLDLEYLASLHEGRHLASAPIAFWHDGYLPELTPQKAARNLPLLEKELIRDPGSFYIALERAATLKALGSPEWRSAEDALARRLLDQRDSDTPPDNTVALFFMRRFADLDEDGASSVETDHLLRMARGWFPDHPGVLSMCAQVEIRRKNLRRALEDLLEVERMAGTGDYDRLTATSPVMLGIGLSTNLALVAHQVGRHDLAERHYRRLLELDPGNPLAQQNLARL